MIWNIAWKNVWRNKLRSAVVIFAVMIGLMAGAFGIALIEGFSKQRTRTVINSEISHIQIHNPEFVNNYEAKFVIEKATEIAAEIKKLDTTARITKRLKINAMANTSHTSTGIQVLGIDPEYEKLVTDIYKYVDPQTGNFFEEKRRNQIVIGKALVKKLKLDRYLLNDSIFDVLRQKGIDEQLIEQLKPLKDIEFRSLKEYKKAVIEKTNTEQYNKYDYFLSNIPLFVKPRAKILLTFLDKNQQLTGAKFSVAGVFKTKNAVFDETNSYVRATDLERLTGFSLNKPQEMAVLLTNKDMAQTVAHSLRQTYKTVLIESWAEISPELKMLSEYMLIYNIFLIVLILAALAFGIVNTMLMAIMERTKELGMLAAIGMTGKRIFSMIMLETVFLTLVGALIGMIANVLIISRLSKTGLDFSKEIGAGFEAMGYDPHIYPNMGAEYYVLITVLVIITAMLSSIYPAIKALHLNPAEAVRSDA